jgi:hypothetical protein
MKKVLGIVIVLAALGVIAYFVLSNPLGRLVKLAVEGFGPDIMQADIRVESVDISTTDGRGKLIGLKLGNPKGFKTDHALKADKIDIVIEPASIAQNVLVLHKVLIDAPHINYESGKNGTNFDAIQRNVESYLGKGKGAKENKGDGKKMIIDSFIIRNAKVNYNNTVDLSLPDIELHNIGKKTNGATSAQVTGAIIAELNKKLALALAKTAAIGAVGGPAIGAGMALKKMLGK